MFFVLIIFSIYFQSLFLCIRMGESDFTCDGFYTHTRLKWQYGQIHSDCEKKNQNEKGRNEQQKTHDKQNIVYNGPHNVPMGYGCMTSEIIRIIWKLVFCQSFFVSLCFFVWPTIDMWTICVFIYNFFRYASRSKEDRMQE